MKKTLLVVGVASLIYFEVFTPLIILGLVIALSLWSVGANRLSEGPRKSRN